MTRISLLALTTLTVLSASLTAPTHAALTVARLRCEYKTNPLAIDLAKPRLSWILESKEKGQKQTAYQIMVGTAPGKVDLWDTSKVLSDETIQIPYDGQALESGQQAFWQVKVWDAKGKSSVSAVAHWTKGLGANDWKAQWIQAAQAKVVSALPPITLEGASWIWLASDPENPPVGKRSFRVQFEAPAGASARIALTADNSYAVAVNGKNLAIAKGSDWKVYNTYDLKDLLVAGANTVVVTVTNEGDAPNPAGLIAKLVVNGRSYPTNVDWTASKDRRNWEQVRILGAAGMAPWGKAEPGGNGNNAMTPPPHFRNRFRVEKPVKRALLYATALGVYELGLNGKPVSDDVFSPGWTEYKKR
ncbi:alpha-L-rhamnosidase N-terminal domain-containing protein, partial [Armatimonas sp.]|uniref:glycoside hydrolase family 78 protein n=1 Tax=Armatimonas sp. TaxID=1872638 RepID=UPI0037518A8E